MPYCKYLPGRLSDSELLFFFSFFWPMGPPVPVAWWSRFYRRVSAGSAEIQHPKKEFYRTRFNYKYKNNHDNENNLLAEWTMVYKSTQRLMSSYQVLYQDVSRSLLLFFWFFFFFGFCIQSHCRWGRFLSYYHYQAMVSALLARLYLITTRLFFLNNIAQCYGKSC